MKKLLALPLVAVLAIMPTSCSTVETARDKLAEMPEVEYQELSQKVYNASMLAGNKLSDLLIDRPGLRSDIRELAVQLQHVVESDSIDVNDVVRYLVDRFGDDLGLEERYQEYIRDAAKAIDAAVGQIRVGIDGALSEREKGLILSLLRGLAIGIN